VKELVGSDAGVLVPPDDLPAMTAALDRMLAEPATRRRCAAGAARVRERLPTWPGACATLARALDAHPTARRGDERLQRRVARAARRSGRPVAQRAAGVDAGGVAARAR
jgi:hypothetical protein